MLVTVFVFLGIEGASVYSRYAKERSDVGVATILGFIGVTTLMVLVTLLPYAVLQRAEIAGMRQPSMATVLEAVVGHWGAVFVSIGLLVSVLGAYLAWSLICAEVLFTAAKTKDMPKVFATREQEQGAGGGAVGDQHRRPAHRHQHLLVARRLRADAEPDQRDVADPLPVRGGVRPDADQRRRDLRGAAAGAQARPHHRCHRHALHGLHALRRRHEVHPALGGPLRARHRALLLGPPRAGQAGLHHRRDWVIFILAVIGAVVGIWWLATGYITI